MQLYPALRLSLDIGQIVPESIGGDLTVVAGEKGNFTLKPVKNAKLYVVTKPIAGVVPKRAPKFIAGESFETRFFAGRYKLHDDGRRSGILKLEVNDSGEITGTFTSDKDGKEYDVQGKAGSPKHAISFTVKFPGDDAKLHGLHVHRRRQSHRRHQQNARSRSGFLRGADGRLKQDSTFS